MKRACTVIPIVAAESLIPSGPYCYRIKDAPSAENGFRMRIDCCPFWELHEDRPALENGYCRYLKQGDWNLGMGLLWDQCKECGANVA